MNADGSGAHAVSNGANDGNNTDTDPVWSPDGTRIVYTSGHNFFELRMVNADGTRDHKLAGGEIEGVNRIASATFSPDGRKILFERQVDTTGETWINRLQRQRCAQASQHRRTAILVPGRNTNRLWTKMCDLQPPLVKQRAKAIRVPSGDQAGP
jgi:Tol biopolymer transport system component